MMQFLVAISILSASVVLTTNAFSVGNGAAFIKGLNQPWGYDYYGHYLGLEPANPSYGVSYSASETASYCTSFKNASATFWRVWLFEAGQGLTIDSNKYASGITSTFFTNFDNLVSQAGANGIYVYPTLFNGAPTLGDMSIFANFLTNTAAQTAIINNVIVPLATHYKGNSHIGAIQIYNELNEWCNPYFSGTVATQAQCASFITAAVKAIKAVDSTRLVSVSQILIDDAYHPVGTNNKDFEGTGVDFYDIHVYNDAGSLVTASSLNLDKPVILGEFGESTGEGDAHQSTVVGNFIANARSGGWAGALYWTLGEPNTSPQGGAGASCSDSTLKWYLYNCEGHAREAYTTFKNA